jgi:L-ribulose-5-phosphate 4-epimerase
MPLEVRRHSPYAFVVRNFLAQAGVDLPNIGTTHSDYFHQAIPCTDDMTPAQIKGNYERETGNVIIERFREMDPLHTPAVLVKNHGPFTWGTDPFQAVENAVVLEQVAKMAAVSYAINPSLEMNPQLIEKHFGRNHGPGAYYGQK